MQGDAQVVEVLNDVLTAELTAINQYFIHAMMCRNWRYQRLAKHSREESIEEMKHAEQLIERILYLEGVPNMQRYMKVNVGGTVQQQHEYDLQLEQDAVARLNNGIKLCRDKGDNGSRMLLEKILREEEEHIDWLEAQLQQIKDLGLENYLTQQIED
jgi:bacterioferritin